MRRLALIGVVLCAGCAEVASEDVYDPDRYVDRVMQDVSAMIEGMSAAHTQRQVVLRSPDFRSSVPAEAR